MAGICGLRLKVTLIDSDNKYLNYPCDGIIQILETGIDESIINAVFMLKDEDGRIKAPVVIKNPLFAYK